MQANSVDPDPPRETGCSDVGGCRISEVNKGAMESQGLYLSVFISPASTTRDQKTKQVSILNDLKIYFEL